jgi:Metallopeptidase family M24
MMAPDAREAIGPAFSMSAMLRARERTFEAVNRVGEAVRPGMSERHASEMAQTTLEAMGMDRLWHRNLVRFGPETLKTFHEPSDPDRVLGEDDVFFVDLGAVWEGHEGDAGDTFVTGSDPERHACAQAARDLWAIVARRWADQRPSGESLYAYAAEQAEAMGWRLNLEIRGHRVSDFPHAIYRAGALGDFAQCPSTGLWILEIQIAHPTRPFGAFFEDLLSEAAPIDQDSE